MDDLTRVLIVVDMQNDFITGSLGTKEAQAILPNVRRKLDEYNTSDSLVLFTADTHYNDEIMGYYLNTHEGKLLPVEHCIDGTDGWRIEKSLFTEEDYLTRPPLCKNTFGYNKWAWELRNFDISTIELVGVCTDICVVSNALILRQLYPEIDIIVDASCCAGTTPENHKAALQVMKSCQIDVINMIREE